MKQLLILIPTVALWSLVARPCQAGIIETLSSNAPDLQHLDVGQTVTITTSLSGLNPGDTLDFLGVDVRFDSSLFGTPSSVSPVLTPTGIVPDVSGFASGGSPGVATGLYDDLFAITGLPILTNGSFFTFRLTAWASGSGVIALNPTPNSVGIDSAGATLPNVTASSDLSYTIELGPAAVPEPATWLLGLLGTTGAAGFCLLSRFRGIRRSMATGCCSPRASGSS
jgi:hypothetical protein